MPALIAEGITAGYGRVPVINDVSLRAEPGAITTIVGPNGAGKSTFAKSLCGVAKPSRGRIWIGDTELTKLPGHMIPRKGLAYVPQNDNVFPSLSVQENLEIGGYALPGSSIADKIEHVLEIFSDLQQAHAKKAGQLSGGQQNMLAMARALMAEPNAIILDEPTAGLSPAYTDVVWQEVELIAATGAAVLVVEQNVDRALAHAHAVYVLVAGTNYVDGTPHDIAALDLGAIFLGHDQRPKSSIRHPTAATSET